MTDEELKALAASNTQGISELRGSIADMRMYQQAEAREWRKSIDELKLFQQTEAREWRKGLDELREFQQTEAREWREQMKLQNTEWKAAMQASYDDVVRMLTQFAEEAAADRQTIREMVQAMFRHQSNGGGQSQQHQ